MAAEPVVVAVPVAVPYDAVAVVAVSVAAPVAVAAVRAAPAEPDRTRFEALSSQRIPYLSVQ